MFVTSRNPKMQKIMKIVEKIADTDVSVLLTGETGTGKEILARHIHQLSGRKGDFIAVNCGGIPSTLIESELFGHTKGSFTGAFKDKKGKIEYAHGGTLFLDEIGEMPIDLQTRLLRVLENRTIEKIGAEKETRIDFRLIAATNRNLEEEIKNGKFREDLYYRLDVINIELPPLRERKEDIPLLIEAYIRHFNMLRKRSVKKIEDRAQDALIEYRWPGNIRELRNTIEMLVVLNENGRIEFEDLPEKIKKSVASPIEAQKSSQTNLLPEGGIDLEHAVTEYEKRLILESLHRTNWVKQQAAKLLNVNRTTLVEKIKRYNLAAG